MQPEFEPFPKIARLCRDMTVSEKIDGTSGQVCIQRYWQDKAPAFLHAVANVAYQGDDYAVMAGSRTRWITPGKSTDNFGFAAWVKAHAEELVIGLGEGRHYGEWWGFGIQRGYGVNDKRFSLFNTARWNAQTKPPACCAVVPVLCQGPFDSYVIDNALNSLRAFGSRAAPGFMQPEGVAVYHSAANIIFKKTLEKDDEPKAIQATKTAEAQYDATACALAA